MGEFLNRAMKFVETPAGPINWRRESVGGYVTFSGRFLIFDRHGAMRSFVIGKIVQRDRQIAEVYLYDPPHFIKNHRHGRCLQLLGPNCKWFKLHFEKPALDFAAAYTYVEHFLTEAYNLTH